MASTSYKAFQEDNKAASSGSYILRILLTGFPKLAIIVSDIGLHYRHVETTYIKQYWYIIMTP